MNRIRIQNIVILIAIICLSAKMVSAQTMGYARDGHMWPSSNTEINVTGTVMIDHSTTDPVYFLDTDGDGIADYYLDFGPRWYVPGGNLSRPMDGDVITVIGGAAEHGGMQGIDVLTMNGDTWRISNEYGAMGWNMEGRWSVTGDLVTKSGILLADTSFFYHHFYLDTDDDGAPDFHLGLGPMWYAPASGYRLPPSGTSITVEGIVVNDSTLPMFMVQTVDGNEWRSLDAPAPWSGTWVPSNHADSAFVYCATDTSSYISFPGTHSGMGMGGMQWPDSTFVEFWGVHPDSLPGMLPDSAILGFYVNMFDSGQATMMDGSWGGRMGMASFNRDITVRFHYPEDFMMQQGSSEGSMYPSWWDESTNSWQRVTTFDLDQVSNTVSVQTRDVARYYTLSTGSVATSVDDSPEMPDRFVLRQNYPNPFNPVTVIEYELPEATRVTVQIFDIVGRLVAEPVSSRMSSGVHRLVFDASDLTSGVYLYRIQAGPFSETKVFTLVR
jgi:Secretion system C-terminal sorting domain